MKARRSANNDVESSETLEPMPIGAAAQGSCSTKAIVAAALALAFVVIIVAFPASKEATTGQKKAATNPFAKEDAAGHPFLPMPLNDFVETHLTESKVDCPSAIAGIIWRIA